METQENQSDLEPKNPQQEELKYDLNHFLKPQRLENESFDRYKERQKIVKMYLKGRLKGQLMWIAKDISVPIKGVSFDKKRYMKEMEILNKKIEEKQTDIKETTNTNITENV